MSALSSIQNSSCRRLPSPSQCRCIFVFLEFLYSEQGSFSFLFFFSFSNMLLVGIYQILCFSVSWFRSPLYVCLLSLHPGLVLKVFPVTLVTCTSRLMSGTSPVPEKGQRWNRWIRLSALGRAQSLDPSRTSFPSSRQFPVYSLHTVLLCPSKEEIQMRDTR